MKYFVYAMALAMTMEASSWSQEKSRGLRAEDASRIYEAVQLKKAIGDSIWPGWSATPLVILLVYGENEYLLFHPRPSGDFEKIGFDSLLQTDVFCRGRKFPASFLATFPAVNGVQTIVVGTPEQTGTSSTHWIVTVLHEHFHQYQYTREDYYPSTARLNLSGGDETGMWMLNYPFPYEAQQSSEAFSRYLKSLKMAVISKAPMADYLAAKKEVQCRLTNAEYRYFNFQLWQEGVARFTEIAVAEFAAANRVPDKRVSNLPDFESYSAIANKVKQGVLDGLKDIGAKRRVIYYSIGAAEALLLDKTGTSWRHRYFDAYFNTDLLFEFANSGKR